MVESAWRSSRTVPNSPGADVERVARRRARRAADDRVDEILDREQLIAVGPSPEDRDPPALADPVEEDLEHAEPLGPDERLRPHDHVSSPRRPIRRRRARPRSSTRRTGRRRRADRSRRSGASRARRRPRSTRCSTARRTPASSAAASTVAVPSTLTERIASREPWIGSAAAACTTRRRRRRARRTSARSRTSPRTPRRARERRIVERRQVERSHRLAVRDEPAREMQPEEAGAAGDGTFTVSPTSPAWRPGRPGRRRRVRRGRRRREHTQRDGNLTQEAPPQAARRVSLLDLRSHEEVMCGAPRESERDDGELDEQDVPIARRPEVVHAGSRRIVSTSRKHEYATRTVASREKPRNAIRRSSGASGQTAKASATSPPAHSDAAVRCRKSASWENHDEFGSTAE